MRNAMEDASWLKDCKRIRDCESVMNRSTIIPCVRFRTWIVWKSEIGGTNDMNLNVELVSRFELKSSFHGVQ